MDEQQDQNNQEEKQKSFGAPRLRATNLLDVLRSDGQDVTELSNELANASYVDENGEYVPPQQRAHHAGSLAQIAGSSRQQNPLGAYGMVAEHGRNPKANQAANNQASKVPAIGSFRVEAAPSPAPEPAKAPKVPAIGSFRVEAAPSPAPDAAPAAPKVPAIGSFRVEPNPAPAAAPAPKVPAIGSFRVEPNPVPATAHKVPAVGSFRVEPNPAPAAAPAVGSFRVDANPTPAQAVGSFRVGDGPRVGGGISQASLDQLEQIDDVEPQFDPNSAMAKLTALAAETGPSHEHTPLGHRPPSAGNPAMQDDAMFQAEMAEFDFINSADNGASFSQPVPHHAASLGAGADYAASYSDAQSVGRQSFHDSVQQEIERMATDFTNDLYADEPNPYVSPMQRRQQGQPAYRDVEVESAYPVDRQTPQLEPTITTNYIQGPVATPVPTFTPNAFTSPFEDYEANQAVHNVVDGEVLPDDYDPSQAFNDENYLSLIANKQAAYDLQVSQDLDPSKHPWTLPKNRMSKIEIQQMQIRESDPTKSALIPKNRIPLDVMGAMDLDIVHPDYSSMTQGPETSVPVFDPPPEGHLLAVDAAMGLPVDNPLLLQSEGGHVIGVIDFNGGMLAQLMYQRDSGPMLDLLYHAPWLMDNYYFRSPGLEQHLAGEWPCVPFGWSAQSMEANRPEANHGFACAGKWKLEGVLHDQAEFLQYVDNPKINEFLGGKPEDGIGSGVMLSFDYPEDLPLQRIVRTIFIGDQEVLFNFTLFPRADCKVPMAAYPLFPMHPVNDRVMLDIEGDGVVYPRQYEPGVSRFLPKSHFVSLDSIALRKDYVNMDGNGLSVDATVLPFNYQTEEVVQMIAPKGRARLYYPNKQLHLVLKWEEEKLPNCILWISNGGRDYTPWDSNNYCIGIAPMIGAFDMADDSLRENNVIEQHGQPTYVQLKAGVPFSFSYSLFIEDLQGNEQGAVL